VLRRLLVFTVACAVSAPALAQVGHDHKHGREELGVVPFPITCEAKAHAAFDRGLALLHSFGYEEARDSFLEAAASDPACGIAQWGVAMSYYHPLWAPPNERELAAGRTAAESGERAGARSDRERRYIAAIGAYYAPGEGRDPRARAGAYRTAMEQLARDFPQDDEARIFVALALLGTAPPGDRSFARQKQAAAILNGLLAKHPKHPGIYHYTIHAFDYPELASLALPAARSYSRTAPASPHALHMPSHIFTRLGLWDECIASNIESAAAGKRVAARAHPGAASFDALHAMDYLEYAYLQQGKDADARKVVDEVRQADRFDEANFAAAYALVAVPARYALERRDWRAGATLPFPTVEMPWQQFAYVRGVTDFANAIGAARSNDLPRAQQALASLSTLEAGLAKQPPAGPYDWAGQVASMRLAAAGWIAAAEGRGDEAVRLLTEAAVKEEAVGKHPVTPGAILPARELLGDLLLELKRPADALAAYERSLADAPKRFNTLAGAARAADAGGQRARARKYYEELLALCGSSCPRPEAKAAQAFLSQAVNGRSTRRAS
jgi:tetratricopeptide (TPR) repeat protein